MHMIRVDYRFIHVTCWFVLVFAIAICKSRGILDIEPLADDLTFYEINSYRSVILGLYIFFVGVYCFLFLRKNSSFVDAKSRDYAQVPTIESNAEDNIVEVGTPRYESPSHAKTNVRQRFRNGAPTACEEPMDKQGISKSEFSVMALSDCQSNLLIFLENIHVWLWRTLFILATLHGLIIALSYSRQCIYIKILDSAFQSLVLSLLCLIVFYEKGYLFPKQMYTDYLALDEAHAQNAPSSASELKRSPSFCTNALTPRGMGSPDTTPSIDANSRGDIFTPNRSHPIHLHISTPIEPGAHVSSYRSSESQDPPLGDSAVDTLTSKTHSVRRLKEPIVGTPRVIDSSASYVTDTPDSIIPLVTGFQCEVFLYIVFAIVSCLLIYSLPFLFAAYNQYADPNGQFDIMDYWYASNSISNVFPHLLLLFLLLQQCADRRISLYVLFQRGERPISSLSLFAVSLLSSALDQYVYDLSGGVLSGKHCEYALYAMFLMTLKAPLCFDINHAVRKFVSDE